MAESIQRILVGRALARASTRDSPHTNSVRHSNCY